MRRDSKIMLAFCTRLFFRGILHGIISDLVTHMDMSLENLTDSFNAFFDRDTRVLILKGDWGVGKTHFWDEYIKLRIEQRKLSQLAYSYVSLFGANSLEDVKKSIFHNAVPLKTKEEVDFAFQNEELSTSWFYERMPHIKRALSSKFSRKASWIGKLTKHSQELPMVGKFANFASRFEYGYISNYLVCFDDLERKGKSLTVREVMGLADELAQRKKCKVVIIFNEKSLEESKEDYQEFQSYREKVVDLEVVHAPLSKRNFDCVFEQEFIGRMELENVVVCMGVKNIRVLRKLKWMVEKFNVYIASAHASIREEFYVHAALLCCEFFIRNKALDYDELLSRLPRSSWMSLKQPETGNPLADRRFDELVGNLKLTSSAFDMNIDDFLRQGFLDSQSLIQTIEGLEENLRRNTAAYKLRDAWEVYYNSFDENSEEFLNGLKAVLDNDLMRIGLGEFSSAINVLHDFGEDISGYIADFVAYHGDSLSYKNKAHGWDLRGVENAQLSAAIKEYNRPTIVMNLDQVSLRISQKSGWQPSDIAFLCSLDVQDYVSWMMESPQDIHTKIVNGLYLFNDLAGPTTEKTAQFLKISNMVKQALIEIGSQSKINKMRVKNLYMVEV